MADKPPPSPAPYNFRHKRDPAATPTTNSVSTQRRPRTSSARTSSARGDTNLSQWPKAQLQEECDRRSLSREGKKEQLIARLHQHMHPRPPPTPVRRSRRHTSTNRSETSALATPAPRASRRRRATDTVESASESARDKSVDDTPVTRSRRRSKNDGAEKPARARGTDAPNNVDEQTARDTTTARARRRRKTDASEQPATPQTRPRQRRSAAPPRTPATRTLPRRAAAASRRTPPAEQGSPSETARRLSMEPSTPLQPWRLEEAAPPSDGALPPAVPSKPVMSRQRKAAKRSSATYTNADEKPEATPSPVGDQESPPIQSSFPLLPPAAADRHSPSTRQVSPTQAETHDETPGTGAAPELKDFPAAVDKHSPLTKQVPPSQTETHDETPATVAAPEPEDLPAAAHTHVQDQSMGASLSAEEPSVSYSTSDGDVEMTAQDAPHQDESVEPVLGSGNPLTDLSADNIAPNVQMQDEKIDALARDEKPDVRGDKPETDLEKSALDGGSNKESDVEMDTSENNVAANEQTLGEEALSDGKPGMDDEEPETGGQDHAKPMHSGGDGEKPDDSESDAGQPAAGPMKRTSFRLMDNPNTSSDEENENAGVSSPVLPPSLAAPVLKNSTPPQTDSVVPTPKYMNLEVTYGDTPRNDPFDKKSVSHTPSSASNILSRLKTPGAKKRAFRLFSSEKKDSPELPAMDSVREEKDADMLDNSVEKHDETADLSLQPASEAKQVTSSPNQTNIAQDGEKKDLSLDEAPATEHIEPSKATEASAPEQMVELSRNTLVAPSASSAEVEEVLSSENNADAESKPRGADVDAKSPSRRGKSPILPSRALSSGNEDVDQAIEEVNHASGTQEISSGSSVEDVDMDEVVEVDDDFDPPIAHDAQENASRRGQKRDASEVVALDDDEESIDEDAEFSSNPSFAVDEQTISSGRPTGSGDGENVRHAERSGEDSSLAEASEGDSEGNEVLDVDEVVDLEEDDDEENAVQSAYTISSLDSPNEENIDQHFEGYGVEEVEVKEHGDVDQLPAADEGSRSEDVGSRSVSLSASEDARGAGEESNGTGVPAVGGHSESIPASAEVHSAVKEDSVPGGDIVAALESDGVVADFANTAPLENSVIDVPAADEINFAASEQERGLGKKRRRDEEEDDVDMEDVEMIGINSDRKPAPLVRKKQRLHDVVTQLHQSMPTPDSTIAEIIRDSRVGMPAPKQEMLAAKDPALLSPEKKDQLSFLERLKKLEGENFGPAVFKAEGPVANAFALPVAFSMGSAYKPPRPGVRVGKSRFRPLSTKAVQPRRIQARGLWDSARLAEHSSLRAAELSAEVQAWRRIPETIGSMEDGGDMFARQEALVAQNAGFARRY